jgi:hypothetical protein
MDRPASDREKRGPQEAEAIRSPPRRQAHDAAGSLPTPHDRSPRPAAPAHAGPAAAYASLVSHPATDPESSPQAQVDVWTGGAPGCHPVSPRLGPGPREQARCSGSWPPTSSPPWSPPCCSRSGSSSSTVSSARAAGPGPRSAGAAALRVPAMETRRRRSDHRLDHQEPADADGLRAREAHAGEVRGGARVAARAVRGRLRVGEADRPRGGADGGRERAALRRSHRGAGWRAGRGDRLAGVSPAAPREAMAGPGCRADRRRHLGSVARGALFERAAAHGRLPALYDVRVGPPRPAARGDRLERRHRNAVPRVHERRGLRLPRGFDDGPERHLPVRRRLDAPGRGRGSPGRQEPGPRDGSGLRGAWEQEPRGWLGVTARDTARAVCAED